jgi:hypothetical protein
MYSPADLHQTAQYDQQQGDCGVSPTGRAGHDGQAPRPCQGHPATQENCAIETVQTGLALQTERVTGWQLECQFTEARLHGVNCHFFVDRYSNPR